jgi:hypothetical protein
MNVAMLKEQMPLMKRQGMLWAFSAFFSVTPSFADAARAGQLATDEALPQALAVIMRQF